MNKKIKNFGKFLNESVDNLENCLLKCDFEKITEDQIPDWTGDDDDLSSYKSDNRYEFGYFGYYDFCIVKLDKTNGDDVLRDKNGSSDFIIKYNNELYMGNWSEGENSLKDDIENEDYITEEPHFADFEKEMNNNNIDFFYRVSL